MADTSLAELKQQHQILIDKMVALREQHDAYLAAQNYEAARHVYNQIDELGDQLMDLKFDIQSMEKEVEKKAYLEKLPKVPIEPTIALIEQEMKLPKTCQSSIYTLQPMQEIGAGAYGKVIEACHLDNCNYVAKITPLSTSRTTDDCMNTDEYNQYELAITRWMGELGIGPRVYEALLCPEKGEMVIIMDRYTGTLTDLMAQGSVDLQPVLKLIDKMHQAGLLHRDLKPDNIFYRYVNGQLQYAIGDFGLAVISNNRSLQQLERQYFLLGYDIQLPLLLQRNGQTCTDWN